MRASSCRHSFGVQVFSGELDEGVLEVRRVELHVTGDHPGRVQGEDHRVDELSGPGDHDVLAVVLDPAYFSQAGQQPVVERAGRQEPDGLAARAWAARRAGVSSATTRPWSI